MAKVSPEEMRMVPLLFHETDRSAGREITRRICTETVGIDARASAFDGISGIWKIREDIFREIRARELPVAIHRR